MKTLKDLGWEDVQSRMGRARVYIWALAVSDSHSRERCINVIRYLDDMIEL